MGCPQTIEYFNPPLNKIPSYLKAEDTEKLVKHLTLSDRPPKNNVIPINKFLTAQLSQTIKPESLLPSPLEHEFFSQSDLNEVMQAKRINHLEEKIADLQLMFQEQMQIHRQLTETLVEQAKTISKLSRNQAETNNQLLKVAKEQAHTISKLFMQP